MYEKLKNQKPLKMITNQKKVIDGEGVVAGEKQEEDNPAPEPKPVSDFEPKAGSPFPPVLMNDAETAIRDYFLSESGSVVDHRLSADALIALAYLALRVITIEPGSRLDPASGVSSPHLVYKISPQWDLATSQNLFNRLLGDYVTQTDFFQDQSLVTSFVQLAQYVPELGELLQKLDGNSFFTLHRYAAVMSMAPNLRDLAAVAMANRQHGFKLTKIGAGNDGLSRAELSDYLQNLFPSSAEIVSAAAAYKVKEVLPTLQELNRVRKLYAQKFEIKL